MVSVHSALTLRTSSKGSEAGHDRTLTLRGHPVQGVGQGRSPHCVLVMTLGGWPPSLEVVTWLILPVVICLSQRLSHACLSIAIVRRNCGLLIKLVIIFLMVPLFFDKRGNSRANYCQ